MANPYPGQPMYYNSQKSKVVAAVLAFFLGTWGIHNFYLGYNLKGFLQLGLTLLGYITAIILIGFVIMFVVLVWAFIEFILILIGGGSYSRDARRIPLN